MYPRFLWCPLSVRTYIKHRCSWCFILKFTHFLIKRSQNMIVITWPPSFCCYVRLKTFYERLDCIFYYLLNHMFLNFENPQYWMQKMLAKINCVIRTRHFMIFFYCSHNFKTILFLVFFINFYTFSLKKVYCLRFESIYQNHYCGFIRNITTKSLKFVLKSNSA